MVDNQLTPAHRPEFFWGCLTATQMVDAKLHALLDEALLLRAVLEERIGDCRGRCCAAEWPQSHPGQLGVGEDPGEVTAG